MWISFGYKPKCCVTKGPRSRNIAAQPIHLNHIMEVPFPRDASARRQSRCSGVAPLSLVVSVPGRISPGCEYMQHCGGGGEEEGCFLEWLVLLHLLCNSYGSLCNHRSLLCAATRRLCCDGEAAERRGCQDEPGQKSTKNYWKYKRVIVCRSLGGAEKKPASSLEGLQCTFSTVITLGRTRLPKAMTEGIRSHQDALPVKSECHHLFPQSGVRLPRQSKGNRGGKPWPEQKCRAWTYVCGHVWDAILRIPIRKVPLKRKASFNIKQKQIK